MPETQLVLSQFMVFLFMLFNYNNMHMLMYPRNFTVVLTFIATLQNLEPQTAHNQQC